MTYEEFVTWVESLINRGRLRPEQAQDLIRQRELFDQERSRIEAEFGGYVVGFLDEELVVETGVLTLLTLALERARGERQLYFEPVPLPVTESVKL